MYHYTYIITNNTELIEYGKYYIGVRSCECDPRLDETYYGSSVYLTEDINRKNKSNFTKTIIKIFDTRNEAMAHEIKLHEQFDVENNNLFYNKYNANAAGFSWYGKHHSKETKEKIQLKRKHQLITKEQIEKFKNTWKSKTDTEIKQYTNFRKQLWNNKSFEEKEAFRKKMSEIGKQYWQTVSGDKIQNRVNKIAQARANRSEQQKKEEFENRSKAQKIAKNNRSYEEIQSFVERRKNTYNNMSQERLDEISEKQSNQMKGRKWYNNGTISKMFFENDVPYGFTPGRKL